MRCNMGHGPAVTSPREPNTQARVRRNREQTWLYVGLAIVMLLCVAARGSILALATGSTQPKADGQALAEAGDTPSYDRNDRESHSANELLALATETETEEEDATFHGYVVASSFEFDHGMSDNYARALVRPIADDTGHLLVSTGLGRGPPAC